jgi:hypothetical protein
MRILTAGFLVVIGIPMALAQQPKGDVFPPVVNGVEYRLKYGQYPAQGWQDGMRFDFSREQCRLRLQEAPEPSVCMIRPETTSL